MKKNIICLIAAIVCSAAALSAQTIDVSDINASRQRFNEMQGMSKPEATKLTNVDALAQAADKDIVASAELTNQLFSFYYRANQQNAEGVHDASVTIPTLDEIEGVKKGFEDMTEALKKVPDMTAKAAGDIKSAKIMDKAKGTKSLNYSTKVYELVTNELEFQGKLLAAIMGVVTK